MLCNASTNIVVPSFVICVDWFDYNCCDARESFLNQKKMVDIKINFLVSNNRKKALEICWINCL